MYCEQCRTQNLETAKFCSGCGNKLMQKEIDNFNDTIQIKDTENIKLKTYTINLKNPKIALILSIIPGLGHIYLKLYAKAFFYFFLFILFGAILYWWILIFNMGLSLYLGYYIWWLITFVSAYIEAEMMNDEEYSNAIKNIIQTIKHGNDGKVSLDDVIKQAIEEGIDETIAKNSVEKLNNKGLIY